MEKESSFVCKHLYLYTYIYYIHIYAGFNLEVQYLSSTIGNGTTCCTDCLYRRSCGKLDNYYLWFFICLWHKTALRASGYDYRSIDLRFVSRVFLAVASGPLMFDRCLFHNRNLLRRQLIQLINQLINLLVRRIDHPLQSFLLAGIFGFDFAFMQVEHLLN
jgi:hypothetical protein